MAIKIDLALFRKEIMSLVLLSKKVFCDADTVLFYNLSGDFNPIHLDEKAARRLVTGKKVIHGIMSLLWALEEYFSIIRPLIFFIPLRYL